MMELFFKKKNLRVRAAAIISNNKGEILLLQQSKGKKSYWLLPGGGIEYGETAILALERELKEELSLNLKEAQFLLANELIDPEGKRHLLQLVFSVKTDDSLPSLNPKEKSITGFGFFPKKEIANMDVRPDIKEYLQKTKLTPSVYIHSKWVEDK